MNDIDYVLIKECEAMELVNKHNLKLWWNGAECFKVMLNNKEVALLEMDLIKVGNEELLEILNFEVFNKGKGIGSIIVEDIKQDGVNIHLNPHDRASKQFWERHGFKEYDDGWYHDV